MSGSIKTVMDVFDEIQTVEMMSREFRRAILERLNAIEAKVSAIQAGMPPTVTPNPYHNTRTYQTSGYGQQEAVAFPQPDRGRHYDR